MANLDVSFKDCRDNHDQRDNHDDCEDCPLGRECCHDAANEEDPIQEAELAAERSFEEWFHRGTGY